MDAKIMDVKITDVKETQSRNADAMGDDVKPSMREKYFGNMCEDARCNAIQKMRTDTRRESNSGKQAQL